MHSLLSYWQLLLPHSSHPGTPSRRMTNLEQQRHPQKLDLKFQTSFSRRPVYVSETMVVGLRQKASHPLVNADSLLSCFHLLLAMANGTASSRLISACTYSTALSCGCQVVEECVSSRLLLLSADPGSIHLGLLFFCTQLAVKQHPVHPRDL